MTDDRESQPAEETIPEPLSPELVLVDPGLASLARERLRAVGDGAALARPAVAPARHQGPAEGRTDARAASTDDAEPLDDAEDGPPLARASARKRRVFVAALAVFAVMAAGLSILFLTQNVSDAGKSGIRPLTTPMESMPVRRTADARQNRRTSETPRAGARTALPRSTKPSVQPKNRIQRPRPSEFPTRVFVWPAVSRATFYRVEFFRRGRKIFEASPTTPRIELPLSWVFRGRHFRLTPATYRWEVRAAFGPRSHPRYGNHPITRSTWTASAAGHK
jgi:hypothetical protein